MKMMSELVCVQYMIFCINLSNFVQFSMKMIQVFYLQFYNEGQRFLFPYLIPFLVALFIFRVYIS